MSYPLLPRPAEDTGPYPSAGPLWPLLGAATLVIVLAFAIAYVVASRAT